MAAIWARYQEKHKGLSTYQNCDNETDCYSSDSPDSDSDYRWFNEREIHMCMNQE